MQKIRLNDMTHNGNGAEMVYYMNNTSRHSLMMPPDAANNSYPRE